MNEPRSAQSVTARDFHYALVAVWLFILLLAIAIIPPAATWRSYLLPAGALTILFLHARAARARS